MPSPSGRSTGNPAAVMPLDRMAARRGDAGDRAPRITSAETAFTVPSERDEADYDLRWFTPTVEVDLCGHATLASGAYPAARRAAIRFSTKSGILTVTRDGRPAVSSTCRPLRVEQGDEPGLLEALGRRARPTFLSRGGNGAAIVLLDDEAAVRAVAPDFAALRKIDRLVIGHRAGRRTGRRQPRVRRLSRHRRGPGDRLGPCRAGALLGRAPRPRPLHRAPGEQARPALIDCELNGDRVILGGHA